MVKGEDNGHQMILKFVYIRYQQTMTKKDIGHTITVVVKF